MITIKQCVFQNKTTKKYKWLSMESKSGVSQRYLFESKTDTTEPLVQTPDVEPKPGNLVDYEKDKTRIIEEGYDIVSEL